MGNGRRHLPAEIQSGVTAGRVRPTAHVTHWQSTGSNYHHGARLGVAKYREVAGSIPAWAYTLSGGMTLVAPWPTRTVQMPVNRARQHQQSDQL